MLINRFMLPYIFIRGPRVTQSTSAAFPRNGNRWRHTRTLILINFPAIPGQTHLWHSKMKCRSRDVFCSV